MPRDVYVVDISAISNINKRDNFRSFLNEVEGAVATFDNRCDASGSDWYIHHLKECMFCIVDILFNDDVESTELIDFYHDSLIEAIVEITINRWQ